MESKYTLRYLPKYVEDLNEIVDYIVLKLYSPGSAINLVNKIEKAILERSYCPLAFEPFKSNRKRKHQYYRIYVDNFVVYYVVIDGIMEVRRIVYKSRDADLVIE
ncbi:MAG: type II toxin-antitoxin system RelE/ParE family toxin [Epulopiscium sp.]|nr:type II toxin-antitoxin system RelE/ParE family toxin [Candidatus Epulonipiscium sp.]